MNSLKRVSSSEKIFGMSSIRVNIYFLGSKYADSKKIYDQTIQKMEKWSKIIYLGISRVLPICLMLPKFIISFSLYYTTDLDRGAFILPFPTW